MKRQSFFSRVLHLYLDGFRNLPAWGKKVWLVILIKGVLVFVIMKFLFFPNFLNKNYDSDQDRSNHVLENLIKSK